MTASTKRSLTLLTTGFGCSISHLSEPLGVRLAIEMRAKSQARGGREALRVLVSLPSLLNTPQYSTTQLP